MLNQPIRPVGIVGYGAYVPRFRLPGNEISRVWTDGNSKSPVREKAVPGLDEDTATMSVEAARNALARAGIDPRRLAAVWVGSESHPYAVKPTGTIVAEAIGATPATLAADWQFACKAGTEAMQAGIGIVGSGMADYALSIGMDTAQGRPGDALEYTAGAGGAAYIVGPAAEALAVIQRTLSYVSDTTDFWRRPITHYPSHAERFSGDPGYFGHVMPAAEEMMQIMGTRPESYDYVIFHQPNPKFPTRALEELGFTPAQWKTGLLVPEIGNTYAGSAMIGLSAVLDEAKPGQRILMVSYGSGAGSDAFDLLVTERIVEAQRRAPSTRDYIRRRVQIDYAQYVRMRKKLAQH
ncbi:MAG: hydroxymethylglutaryl-CoA synthase [Caldilineaceae bacterium]|nr:hydroxymethylglutaryl-CoA synthase [Caldilineaceae bacterium]MCB9118847.1 hydroxymethylglutaryl-CoA synthase [Caldilineaceae bacterium]